MDVRHDKMKNWLDTELAGSTFKDERLSARFKTIVENLSRDGEESIPKVCEDWAATKAAYRFLSNDRVDESDILEGHQQQTRKRINACDGPVLILHDTTEFSFKRKNEEAIGWTRKSPTLSSLVIGIPNERKYCGVLMHASLAVTPEGLPLGLISTQFWSRKVFKDTDQMKRFINPTRVPLSEKESIKWLHSLENVHGTGIKEPSQLIHIGDRENDIYEYFCECERLNTHFIVRACVNRLANESTLVEEIACHRRSFKHRIQFIQSDGKMIKATLELKYRRLVLHPSMGKQKAYPDLIVTVVSAVEIDAPANRKPISWNFITNLPVDGKRNLIQVLEWYKQRWKVEIYFKVLKSGFRIEESKLRTADRLSKLISIYCILAWRIQWITWLKREHDKLKPDFVFNVIERKLLKHYHKKPDEVETLNDYILQLAKMGGYLARKNDPPPGIQIIWRGLSKLADLCLGFRLALDVGN